MTPIPGSMARVPNLFSSQMMMDLVLRDLFSQFIDLALQFIVLFSQLFVGSVPGED